MIKKTPLKLLIQGVGRVVEGQQKRQPKSNFSFCSFFCFFFAFFLFPVANFFFASRRCVYPTNFLYCCKKFLNFLSFMILLAGFKVNFWNTEWINPESLSHDNFLVLYPDIGYWHLFIFLFLKKSEITWFYYLVLKSIFKIMSNSIWIYIKFSSNIIVLTQINQNTKSWQGFLMQFSV